MSRLLALSLILLPVATSAQEGSVLYDRAMRYDFELPPGREELRKQIPSQSITRMILLFDESGSLMKEAPKTDEEELSDAAQRIQGYVTRLKMGSASRSDNETLLAAYVSHDDGTVSQTRDFMGRTFLIKDSQPAYAWKLTGEQSQFLGHMTQKATAVRDSSTIEAWFTPEIPVSTGPGSFGGLPGLILAVSVDDGHLVYSATEIDLRDLAEDAIEAPAEGREVSRDEYEKIVAQKLEERKKMVRERQSQRRRRGGDRPR